MGIDASLRSGTPGRFTRPLSQALLALVVGGATITGCSTSPHRPDQSAGTGISAGPNDVGASLPPAGESPVDDVASDLQARVIAAEAMTRFTDTVGITTEQWFAELRPLLTDGAAAAYAFTDPAQVPARAITGDVWLEDSGSAYLSRPVVPTDVGDYRLLLVRDDGDSPWQVQEINPPAGIR